jgi:hypothetical protein
MATPTKSKAPKEKALSLRLDRADADLIDQIRERDGVPASEQIRRGLQLWFEQKGVLKQKRKS